MRIAIVADAPNFNVRSWTKGLVDAGAAVDIISFEDDPDACCPVHRLDAPAVFGAKARYLLAGPSVRRTVAELRPDLVIGYYVTGYGSSARLARHPVTVQVAIGNDVLVNPPGTLTRRFAHRNLAEARLVVAWSAQIADGVRTFGVEKERILTLMGGIDLAPYGEQDPGGDPLRLVTSRALGPYYRHEVLIDSVAALDPLPFELTFIGSGPIRSELEGRVATRGVADRVTFAGRVSEDEKVGILYRQGVYVSACPTDGVSASLLESMAVGLFPIVVDDVANRDWIETGVNGLLYDGSVSGLTTALREVNARPELLSTARTANRRLVAERADRRRNSTIFLSEFARLVG